ncbi:hypothetical protein Tco_0826678 [Tanacetum coccineum]
MANPDITVEEYIRLEEEKARRRGQNFNWETARYGKVSYFEDFDYFRNFKNEFPTIVYNDALTSELEVSSEPMVNAHHAKKFDFDFVISYDEFDDKDYTFIYDRNSFSYKLVSVNDLNSDSDSNDNKIDIKTPFEDVPRNSSDDDIDINVNTYSNAFDENIVTNHMAPLPPRDQRHLSLIYEGRDYTNIDIQDFEDRLGMIYDRQELILEFFSTIRIAAGVLNLDSAETLHMDEGVVANVLYLLAQYLLRYTFGRKQGARKSGGHFVARLAEHFGLITEESLWGLIVVVCDLMMIDMDELVRLRICERLGDVWAWVAPRPERQQGSVAGAAQADKEIP